MKKTFALVAVLGLATVACSPAAEEAATEADTTAVAEDAMATEEAPAADAMAAEAAPAAEGAEAAAPAEGDAMAAEAAPAAEATPAE